MKFGLLLLLLLTQVKFFAQDSTAKIDERFLHATVNIENYDHGKVFTGTGFVVGVIVDSSLYLYLVTNKHVISNNYTPFDPVILSDSIFVNFYLDSNIYRNKKCQIVLKDKLRNPLPIVKLHPNSSIDVAVIDITTIFIKNPELSFSNIDTSRLAHFEHLKNINLGLGSQIFALGYPAAQRISNGNLPIGKFGYIASSLSEQIEYDVFLKDQRSITRKLNLKGKFFIVDGLLIGGNSGSPIINPKEVKTYFSSSSNFSARQQFIHNYVVGILSLGVPGTGLSIIYSSDYILELIREFKRG